MNTEIRPSLRQKLRESTREAILEAAVHLIINSNSDIRMEDIAERAGVATGTIYNYFDNRQMLIDTIIERRRAAAEAHIRQSLEQTKDQGIASRLECLFATLISFLSRHRAMTHHTLQMKEIRENGTGKRSLIDMLNDCAEEMLDTATKRGELKKQFREIYPLVINGFLRDIFLKAGEEPDIDPDLARQLADLFLNGAARRGTR